MLATFIIVGYCIQHDFQKRYWTFGIWCIVSFTLILGLRYGRGNDYMHYIDVYKYNLESNEILFTFINAILKSIGVGEHYFFMYYNFLFIVGGMSLLKLFRKNAQFLLPLFLIAFIFFAEFMIRQALGFAFVFLFLKTLIKIEHTKQDLFLLCIYSLCTLFIHSANIIYIFLFVILYVFIKKPFSPNITIPAFLFSTYIFSSVIDYSFLTSYLSLLGGMDNKIGEYASDSATWLSADNSQTLFLRNPVIKVWQTYGECALIYLTYKVLELYRDEKYVITYNVYIIGLLFMQCFLTFEFLNRVGSIIYYFWAFPLSLTLRYFTRFWNKGIKYRFLLLGLSFYLYEYLKLLFLRENGMFKFIWDASFQY